MILLTTIFACFQKSDDTESSHSEQNISDPLSQSQPQFDEAACRANLTAAYKEVGNQPVWAYDPCSPIRHNLFMPYTILPVESVSTSDKPVGRGHP